MTAPAQATFPRARAPADEVARRLAARVSTAAMTDELPPPGRQSAWTKGATTTSASGPRPPPRPPSSSVAWPITWNEASRLTSTTVPSGQADLHAVRGAVVPDFRLDAPRPRRCDASAAADRPIASGRAGERRVAPVVVRHRSPCSPRPTDAGQHHRGRPADQDLLRLARIADLPVARDRRHPAPSAAERHAERLRPAGRRTSARRPPIGADAQAWRRRRGTGRPRGRSRGRAPRRRRHAARDVVEPFEPRRTRARGRPRRSPAVVVDGQHAPGRRRLASPNATCDDANRERRCPSRLRTSRRQRRRAPPGAGRPSPPTCRPRRPGGPHPRRLRQHQVVQIDLGVRRPAHALVQAGEHQQVLHQLLEPAVSARTAVGELAWASSRPGCSRATSACCRIAATGERSSCDASETNRRCRSTERLQPAEHRVHRGRQPGDLVVAGRGRAPAGPGRSSRSVRPPRGWRPRDGARAR